MTHLDLFTGIGGFHLAAGWAGFETIGFSEVEPYCCKLLAEKWPGIKNYGDIRTADFSGLRGRVTVLSAGVPCQPASLAGKRRGKDDDRWLWEAVLDVVGRVGPAWVVLENPPGILTLDEFGGVLLRLESLGYAVRAFSVPANSVGAKHRRQRVFIVAHAERERCDGRRAGWREAVGSGSCDAIIGSGADSETLAGAAGEVVAHADVRSFGAADGRGGAVGSGVYAEPERSGQDTEALADADGERCGQRWAERGLHQGEGNQLELEERGEALADAETRGIRRRMSQRETRQLACSGEALADADRAGLEEHQSRQPGQCEAVIGGCGINGAGELESRIRRVADDVPHWPYGPMPSPLSKERIPNRSARLKALGNSCVPAQAYPFFAAIARVERGL